MTTLVALATKHALVMGSDSLGTQTQRMVNPFRLQEFFDDENFRLRTNAAGEPVLKDLFQLMGEAEQIPYNQLLHVNKLFRIGRLPMGAMFTGVTSLGNHTIRGLVASFTDANETVSRADAPHGEKFTVKEVAKDLLGYLRGHYKAAFPEKWQEQSLQLLFGGFDEGAQFPSVFRLDLEEDSVEEEFPAGEFGIVFAGQMDAIQRIVFGTDIRNRVMLARRNDELLARYKSRIEASLAVQGLSADIPSYDGLRLFDDEWRLFGLDANWGDFSEQNAIDCVDFFLDVMIRSQDVSSQLPTVGGNVHIAVIRRDGFHAVTKEVWKHGDHEFPIPEVGI